MFKKLLAPLQHWLLHNDYCVGCAMPLRKGEKHQVSGITKVFCKCGRIFIQEAKGYRRALFEEV